MRKTFAYRKVVFLQGDEATPILDILENKGEKAAVLALAEYDYGEGDVQGNPPWGNSDTTMFKGGYYLSYNTRLGYVGISAPVTRNQVFQWEGQKGIERIERESN